MSVEAIRAGFAALLTAAGAKNVYEEQRHTLTEPSDEDREHEGRLHYWTVSASRAPGVGGAGYIDRRIVVTAVGLIGLSRDEPTSGTRSDDAVVALFDDVVREIEKPASGHAGGALDFEGVAPSGPSIVEVNHKNQRLPAHQVRLVATYVMEN